MDRERVNAWMEPPGITAARDGVALLRAYHLRDTEGMATLLENCNPYATLKAVVSFYEATLQLSKVDTCEVLDGFKIADRDEDA